MTSRRLAIASLTAFALTRATTVAQTAEPTIRVSVGPVDAAAPLFYAAKVGLYRRYGLDVELVKLTNSSAILASIAGGSAQLGQGSTLGLVQAFSRGLPLVAIGGLETYDSEHPDYGMLVLASSPIKTPKDLEGKVCGVVGLQDMFSLATFAWLDAHGVDRSTIKFVEMPLSAALAAMQQGRIDVATFYEPFFSAGMATGTVRILGSPLDALGKHFADAVLYGTPQWTNDHRDLTGKFLRATQEAAIYVAAHEREVAPITAEYTSADRTALAGMRHGGRSAVLDPAQLQPIIDAAAKYQFIPKAFSASDLVCTCALRR
jgi:NitT/TauT family transport system substrate-binding protein